MQSPVCRVYDKLRSQEPAFPRGALRRLHVHAHCYPDASLRGRHSPLTLNRMLLNSVCTAPGEIAVTL